MTIGGITVREPIPPIVFVYGDHLVLAYAVADTEAVRDACRALVDAGELASPHALVVDVSTATVLYISREHFEPWLALVQV